MMFWTGLAVWTGAAAATLRDGASSANDDFVAYKLEGEKFHKVTAIGKLSLTLPRGFERGDEQLAIQTEASLAPPLDSPVKITAQGAGAVRKLSLVASHPLDDIAIAREKANGMAVRDHYRSADLEPTEDEIVLTLQGDCTRGSKRIKKLAGKWQGPISAALLCTPAESAELDATLFDEPLVKKFVDVHLCSVEEQPEHYPINKMRNQAIKHARGKWVFVLDIDEDPVFTQEQAKNELKLALSGGFKPETSLFAIASFNWDVSTGLQIPKSVKDLSNVGQVEVKASFLPMAYTPPKIGVEGWKKLNVAETVPYTDMWEPYYIAQKDAAGVFDERFVGWGANKVLHSLKLALEGKHYVMMPRLFTFTDELGDEGLKHKLPLDAALPDKVCAEMGIANGCAVPCDQETCAEKCLGSPSMADMRASRVLRDPPQKKRRAA